jgi:hypothetical protein
MTSNSNSNILALRAEVEASRTRLKDTASALRQRLQPAVIQSEVAKSVGQSGNRIWHSLQQRAKENPLQAVAIGSMVALPALSILRSLPTPMLLLGAGLLLTRTSANEALQRVAGDIAEQTKDVIESAKGHLSASSETVRRAMHDTRDYLTDNLAAAADAASSVTGQIQESAATAASQVQASASKISGTGEALIRDGRRTVSQTWDQNPLLLAGIGLGLGALIAAAFPATKAERVVLGDAANTLRQTAENAGVQGVQAVRETIDKIAGTAKSEGFSPDGISEIGKAVAEKTRAVAERGISTAFGLTDE